MSATTPRVTASTYTASVERRSRGGRWRIDSILLAAIAWAPTAIWFAACCVGSSY